MLLNRFFRKKGGVTLALLILLLVAIQFVRPKLDNPPVTSDFTAPPAVKEIIKRACYDCHSNETNLAWFDKIVPAYWLVANHTKQGRAVLNFSYWDILSKPQQAAKLFESINQIEFNIMPLKQYNWLHHGGRINAEEIAVLKQYLLTLAPAQAPDTAKQKASLDQYEKWIQEPTPPANVKATLNGIAYGGLAGFSNWQAISTTERFDNGTLRVIFGNDVAVKAIREGHTNPWPGGAIFAKAAWDQSADSTGIAYAGAFKQVEFMIRDKEKYASTAGWGWARWVGGMALKPYGKDALFTTECMNCHKPMENNDQVFTIPRADTLSLYDQAAFLPDSLASHPLAGKVITSFVDKHQGTMSTLYGNDTAINSARAGRISYPAGSALSLVTWSQQEDKHWFGARIPGTIRSIEQIVFRGVPGGGAQPSYERYEGAPLKRNPETDPGTIQKRIMYIASRKASVMPL